MNEAKHLKVVVWTDPELYGSVGRILHECADFEVVAFPTAEAEFRAELESHAPDLVVLDERECGGSRLEAVIAAVGRTPKLILVEHELVERPQRQRDREARLVRLSREMATRTDAMAKAHARTKIHQAAARALGRDRTRTNQELKDHLDKIRNPG